MEAFVGTIMVWPMSWAPVGWQLCDGSLLPINQNQALFSLLSTTYGGNGITTFAVPDLRGRMPVGAGQGPGLAPYVLGQLGGHETTALTAAQIPQLSLTANIAIPAVSNSNGDAAKPSPTTSLCKIQGASLYSDAVPDTTLKPFTANATGGGNSAPVDIRQPYLTMNFIICLNGFYPSRP